MVIAAVWIYAVSDPGWKNSLFCGSFFPFCYFRCHLLFFYMISAKASIVKARYTWQFLFLLNMAVQVILQCAGIIDIFLMLPMTHILMLVTVVYTLMLIHYEAEKIENEAAREFKYPLYIIMVSGAAELALYYIRNLKLRPYSFRLDHGIYCFADLDTGIQIL